MYSDEEMSAALAKLAPSIAYNYGSLGNRDVGSTFSELQQAATAVLVQDNDAPYYVVLLAADQANKVAEKAVTALQQLYSLLLQTVRRSNHVGTSELATAVNALSSLAANRENAFSDVTAVSSFNSFEQSASRFLASVKSAIVYGTDVVPTSDEALATVTAMFNDCTDLLTELNRRIVILSQALTDFANLKLSSLLASFVISKSELLLKNDLLLMKSQTEEQRLSSLRAVVLDVLAAKAMVRGFSSNPSVASTFYGSGVSSLYVDADHPAVPASMTAALPGPYDTTSKNTLLFEVNGQAVTLNLPLAYVPTLDGYGQQPLSGYVMTNGNAFNVVVSGLASYLLYVPAGTYAADDLCAQYNAGLASVNAMVRTAPYCLRYNLYSEPATLVWSGSYGYVTRDNGAEWAAGANDTVFVLEGDYVGCYRCTGLSGDKKTMTLARLSGAADTMGTSVVVNVGVGLPYIQVVVAPDFVEQVVSSGAELYISVISGTATALGFMANIPAQSYMVSAADCVSYASKQPDFNKLMSASVAKSTILECSLATVPGDKSRLALVGTPALGSLVVSASISFVPAAPTTFSPAVLVITASDNPEDVGAWGYVAPAGPGAASYTLTMNRAVSSGAVATELYELDLRALSANDLFVTVGSNPATANAGEYAVQGEYGTLHNDLSIAPTSFAVVTPLLTDGDEAAKPLITDGSIYRQLLNVKVRSVDTPSTLRLVGGTAAQMVFNTVSAEEVGYENYINLSEYIKKVLEGDYLEFYETNSPTPTRVLTITSVEGKVLGLSSPLPVGSGPWADTEGASAPCLRIRKSQHNSYAQLKTNLDGWLALPDSSIARFTARMRRALNLITASDNPRIGDVSSAMQYVEGMWGLVSDVQTYLQGYTAKQVASVDTLLAALMQQGSSRAADLLREANFAEFFGVDRDTASYSGTVQKAVKDIGVYDLPIDRVARKRTAQLLQSYQDTDFEFSSSDAG